MALKFEDHGLKRLHIVDLDGARMGKVINYKIIEKIAARTSLVMDVGGGLKTDEDLKIVFESGVEMATGGSIAVKNPERMESWISQYGSDRIILGSDFKEKMIAVSGWTEQSDQELMPFLESWMKKGITQTICTDVSKDGLLQGTSLDVYNEIVTAFPDLYLIASGGISGIADIEELAEKNIPAVIIGKAIYEGKISLKEFERFL